MSKLVTKKEIINLIKDNLPVKFSGTWEECQEYIKNNPQEEPHIIIEKSMKLKNY